MFPFDPALVLDKLRPRNQTEPTPRGLSGGLSKQSFCLLGLSFWDEKAKSPHQQDSGQEDQKGHQEAQ